MPTRISAALIVLNEAARLPALFDALRWVDELVVIDGGSADNTVAVCRQYTNRVSVHPFSDYAAQRNEALRRCTTEWVLSIDADERPSAGLADEVRRRIAPVPEAAGFRVPIRSRIFGQPFQYCGTQDDRPIRLFRRDRAHWSGPVHEVLEIDGAIGRFDAWLEHDTLPDLHAFLMKMDLYTTLEAQTRVSRGLPWRKRDLVWQPTRELLRRLIWKRGLLDGPLGWLFCGLSGLSALVAHVKHAELLRQKQGGGVERRDGPDPPPSKCLAPWRLCVRLRRRRNRQVIRNPFFRRPHMLVRRAELEAAVADQFDRVRDRLPSAHDREPVFESALQTALNGTRGGRLLDLGCGKGRFLPLWCQAGFEVVALDRSRGMLCRAQENAAPAARAGFVCATASELPFADACFDAVAAVEVIEHLPDVPSALREMHRVLRPEGRLLLLDKNVAALDSQRPYVAAALVKWVDQRRGLWMYPPGFVFRERWFWVPGLLRRLRRNFTDVRVDYLLSPAESQGSGGWLFRRIPQLRRFVLVTGRKPALN